MSFRRSSMIFNVDKDTLLNVKATIAASPKVHPQGTPALAGLDEPAIGFHLDPLDEDQDDKDEKESVPVKFRRRGRLPSGVMKEAKFDDELDGKMQRQISNSFLSGLGATLLRVAKAYREEIMAKHHPWKGFVPAPFYEARRLMYDTESHRWIGERVLVQLAKTPFDRGALRECFKMKELRGRDFADVHKNGTIQVFDAQVSFIRPKRTCWVAKRYMDSKSFSLHKQDVAMQMVAKHYAEEFARIRLARRATAGIPHAWKEAVKPVDFLMTHLVDFPYGNVPDTPSFSVEAFVYGKYDKYNTNSGMVAGCRKTPQCFSHFTFEHSQKSLICVDVQGVDDLYTDPAVHAPNKFLWCDANLGFRGMALFFWSHRCNDACRCMQLRPFPTYAELVEQKKTQTGATVSELARDVLSRSDSTLAAIRIDKTGKTSYSMVKLENLLSWPRVDQWMDLPRIHHPHQLSTAIPPELVEPCIHMEMAWMYATGRLTDVGASQGEKSAEGAIYHLQLAARGGLVCALLALARLCSDFSHDEFLPMVLGHSVDLCLRLLECAVTNGSADAAGSLATLCEQGTYDEEDYAKAADMYEHYAKLTLELEDNEVEIAYKDEDADAEDEKKISDSDLLAGVARPTAWTNGFGWENHGLTPHKALAAAARLYEQGNGNLPKSLEKAIELYRWASEVASEAGIMKASMRYSEQADELEGAEEEEEEEAETNSTPIEEAEEVTEVKLPSKLLSRLEKLCKQLEKNDFGAVVEHLLNNYSQDVAARRSAVPTAVPLVNGVPLRSCLKKTRFTKAIVEEEIPPVERSDDDDSDADTLTPKSPMRSSNPVEPGSPGSPTSRSKRGSFAATPDGAAAMVLEVAKMAMASASLQEQNVGASIPMVTNQPVRVEVVDRFGKPIEGASVKIIDSKRTATAAQTDSHGGASIQRSCKAILKVEKSGYAPCRKLINMQCNGH